MFGALPPELTDNSRKVDAMLEAVETGRPLVQNPENVTNQNSLQVKSASRYVYSSTGDFALVEHMLRRNPDLGTGGPALVLGGFEDMVAEEDGA